MSVAPLLLDTHAAVWFRDGTLPQAAEKLIVDRAPAREIYVSPVTAWEIAMLSRPDHRRSTLRLKSDPFRWFEELIAISVVRLAICSPAALIDATRLPEPIHNDPADRILIATARELGATLMTRDQRILDYAKAGHVQAVPC